MLFFALPSLEHFRENSLAIAADQVVSKTREQVRAELIEAQRTGNIVADGETGMLLKDLYPSQYRSQATAQAKSRDDVRAELENASKLIVL